jgi:hypothetical protein
VPFHELKAQSPLTLPFDKLRAQSVLPVPFDKRRPELVEGLRATVPFRCPSTSSGHMPGLLRVRSEWRQMLDEVVGDDAVVLLLVVVPHLVEPRSELFEDRAVADMQDLP